MDFVKDPGGSQLSQEMLTHSHWVHKWHLIPYKGFHVTHCTLATSCWRHSFTIHFLATFGASPLAMLMLATYVNTIACGVTLATILASPSVILFFLAMRQLGSHTPPCHRRMVITTLFNVLLAALQRRQVLYHTRWLLAVHWHWSSGH